MLPSLTWYRRCHGHVLVLLCPRRHGAWPVTAARCHHRDRCTSRLKQTRCRPSPRWPLDGSIDSAKPIRRIPSTDTTTLLVEPPITTWEDYETFYNALLGAYNNALTSHACYFRRRTAARWLDSETRRVLASYSKREGTTPRALRPSHTGLIETDSLCWGWTPYRRSRELWFFRRQRQRRLGPQDIMTETKPHESHNRRLDTLDDSSLTGLANSGVPSEQNHGHEGNWSISIHTRVPPITCDRRHLPLMLYFGALYLGECSCTKRSSASVSSCRANSARMRRRDVDAELRNR